MMNIYNVVLCATLCLQITAETLPANVDENLNILLKYFEICPRNEKFNDCLKQSLQTGLPRLADGIAELKVKPFDPLDERLITIEYEENLLKVHAVMRNARLIGFSKAEIQDVSSEFRTDGLSLKLAIRFPHMIMDGFFKGDGRFTALPFQLKGDFNITTEQVSGVWHVEGKTVNINNIEYVQIKQIVARPKVGDMKVHIDNVFPGNRELNDVINRIINDNWRVIFHEILPFAGDYWNATLTNYANQIFLKIPYKNLIPNP